MNKSNSKNILLFASGKHVDVLIDAIIIENKYEIFGIVSVDGVQLMSEYDYQTFSLNSNLYNVIKENNIQGGIFAIDNNNKRKKVSNQIRLQIPNFKLIKLIHPEAIIGKDVEIGEGSIILAGAVINSDSVIGDCCILNIQSSLGHEGKMDDYSSLSFGVITGGNFHLGENSSIMMGSSIIENISIGKNTIVKEGSLVINNFLSNKIVFGVPAKEVSSV